MPKKFKAVLRGNPHRYLTATEQRQLEQDFARHWVSQGFREELGDLRFRDWRSPDLHFFRVAAELPKKRLLVQYLAVNIETGEVTVRAISQRPKDMPLSGASAALERDLTLHLARVSQPDFGGKAGVRRQEEGSSKAGSLTLVSNIETDREDTSKE